MVEVLRSDLDRRGKCGGQCKLSVEDQLLLVLEYWREEYRTQFHIATSWGLSESAVCRLIFEGRNAVNALWAIPVAWKKATLPKCLQLEGRSS